MSAMAWEDAGRMAWQNLLLLGFDPDEAEKKHGVVLCEQTFLQQQMAGSGLGPHKAMEVVMNFLMLKTIVTEAQAPLKMLFPVMEKQQARDFRKFLTDNLGALQKARELPPAPLIRSTVFDTPCGPKFCQVLFHVTQFTMKRQMLAMKKSAALAVPTFQRQNARSLVRVARHRVAHERQLFFDHIRRAGAAQEHWTQFVHEFVDDYQSATGKRAEVAAAQQVLLSNTVDSEICLDHSVAEARAEDADKSVRSMWTVVADSIVASAPEREAVERLLINVGHEKSINITALVRQRSQELDPSAPIVDERLDMEALLQRWAANIGQVHRQLLQNTAGRAGLERLAASAPDVQGLAQESHARFVTAQNLRSQLAADVEGIRRSIMDLRRNVEQRYAGAVMDHDASLEQEEATPHASFIHSLASRASPKRDDAYFEHVSRARELKVSGSGIGGVTSSPSSRDTTSASRASTRSPSTFEATQLATEVRGSIRASPMNGMSVHERSNANVNELDMLDMRTQHLRQQLASPRVSRAQASSSFASSAVAQKPSPLLPSSESGRASNGIAIGAKPSPPATPPPLFAALRGKRLSHGDSTPSPPCSKTVLVQQEVLVGKEVACDPALSEIQRRRASLRSKLAGALEDDILAPLSIAGRAPEVLKMLSPKMLSPPKQAGKGSVVQDDNLVGRYFDD